MRCSFPQKQSSNACRFPRGNVNLLWGRRRPQKTVIDSSHTGLSDGAWRNSAYAVCRYSCIKAKRAIYTRGVSAKGTSNAIPSARNGSAAGDDDEESLDLRECRHFVNLTNGIEAVPMLHELQMPYSFVRIQSTACEQQNLEALMSELDANLLISLALGHCCLVYDCGSRRRDGTPRALWYGLEFLRYTLTKLWLRRPCTALLRGKNVARTFDEHIRSFRQSTTRRLMYYAKYIPQQAVQVDDGADGVDGGTGGADGSRGCEAGSGPALQRVRLYGVHRPTDHDEDLSFFVRTLHRHQLPQQRPPSSLGSISSSSSGTDRSLPSSSGSWTELGASEGGAEHGAAGSVACGGRAGTGAEKGPVTGLQTEMRFQTQIAEPVIRELGQQRHGCDDLEGSCQDPDQDGEAILGRYGFRLFRRGLSQTEWAAQAQKAGTVEGD